MECRSGTSLDANVDDASCVFEQTTLQVNRGDDRISRGYSSRYLVVAFGLFVQDESSRSHLFFVLSTCLILCVRSLINVLERFCVR